MMVRWLWFPYAIRKEQKKELTCWGVGHSSPDLSIQGVKKFSLQIIKS